ncbi:AAA family ATPase [Nonomuraea sp. NPDC050556]|uniref:helix-turn-helix transcriptional regulator n=1 Tax=Nonomuraea sp. NPDC050556 TaxID=3364369 RepID=UPI00378BA7F1
MPSGPAPHFVGRERELGEMLEALDRARLAVPGLILVDGPQGIGKTALANHFVARAGEGLKVLRASGDEAEMTLPYGVLEQLTGIAASRVEPLAMGSTVLDLLGDLQELGPVVLVVDDVQWVDRLSLQALTFVLRRLRRDKVLTVLTTRDADSPWLPESLRRVLHDSGVCRLTLDGFGNGELDCLCGLLGLARPRPVAAERLLAHTRGNPLHTLALLEELPVQAINNMGSSLPAPRSYALLTLGQLARCGEPVRLLVQAVSVLGMSTSLRNAAALAEVADPLAAFDEAAAAGLLELQPGQTSSLLIGFPHPLVRATVYDDLGAGRRVLLHLRAAELVTSAHHRLVHRVAAAVGPDPQLAAELTEYARAEATNDLWSGAADHLLQAAYLSDTPAVRGRLLAETLGAFLLDGRIDEAKRVNDLIPADAEPAIRSYAAGHLAAVAGQVAEGESLLTEAWAGLDPAAHPVIAWRTAQQLAMLSLMQARGRDSAEWAGRALGIAADRPATDLTDFTRLTALCVCGAPDEALATTGNGLDYLLGRGLVRTCVDDLAGALEDLRGVVNACRNQSIPFQVLATAILGQAEFRAGQWDDALLHTGIAASLADDAEQAWIAPICHALAALVPAARGDWDQAEEHLLAGQKQLAHGGGVAARTHLAYSRAELAAAQSDHHGVLAALQPLLEFALHDIVHEPGVVIWHDLLADALIALGACDRAQVVLDRQQSLAAARNRVSVLTVVARSSGNLHAARHRSSAAESAFLAGMDHSARVEAPFVRAKLCLHYGAFLRRTGRRAAAVVQLRAAQAILTGLRAVPYLNRCEQELSAAGQPSGQRRDPRLGALTPQELAVTQLVIKGMTNRQVATKLVLSVKTIEYHLGNAYAKLDVTSRTGLTAKLAEMRLESVRSGP